MSATEKKGVRISRRGFLASSAVGAAGLAVAGCTSNKLADFLELS
jgi:hypothetical protein